MRLRVVGSSSAVPRPGRACSCYLLECGPSRIALDFGSGALGSLRRFVEAAELDAVLITHLHPDHFIDLLALRYALAIPPTDRPRPLDVYLPPGGVDRLTRLAEPIPTTGREPFFSKGLALREYDPAHTLEIGTMRVRFAPTVHYIEAYAMRVECGGSAAAYSSDTAPCRAVTELARGVDLFICECTLGPHGAERFPRGHSSAREAGEMAAGAGAKRLMLTHYGSEARSEQLAEAAAAAFEGAIIVADDGIEVSI